MGDVTFYCLAKKCLTTLLFAQEHLQSLVDLQKLVDSVLDGNTHPHAIDGQQLSEPLQATANGDADMHKGSADQPQAAHFPSNSIDIVQLLQVGCLGVNSSPIPTTNARVSAQHVITLVGWLKHCTVSFSCWI